MSCLPSPGALAPQNPELLGAGQSRKGHASSHIVQIKGRNNSCGNGYGLAVHAAKAEPGGRSDLAHFVVPRTGRGLGPVGAE